MCVYECSACIHDAHCVHALVPVEVRRRHWILEIGVNSNCESLDAVITWIPLLEQQGLLTTEPSLQPRECFKNSRIFLQCDTHLQSANKCYTNPLTANEWGLEENGLCPLWGQLWGTDEGVPIRQLRGNFRTLSQGILRAGGSP